MVAQVMRRLLEFYINTRSEIQDMFHILEVNDNISNFESSMYINWNILNEEMEMI
jgi:GTP-binding protein EngB required for normal cell division